MQISSCKYIKFSESANYDSSAKLTGAGLGMKSHNNRNFEAGILSDDSTLLEQAIEQFDSVWRSSNCKTCSRKGYCPDPII